jgi:curli biogenesis system outer membrane secretion channel CsgG
MGHGPRRAARKTELGGEIMRAALAALAAAVVVGCGTSTTTKYSRDSMQEIGNYTPPPSGYAKSRAAIVDFMDKTGSGQGYEWSASHQPGGVTVRGRSRSPIAMQASDAFISLVSRSDRFSLIERSAMEKILQEQGLVNAVDPSELAKPGKIRGIDYLFIGAITNFQVKTNRSRMGGGVFDAALGSMAPVKIDTSKTEIEVQVGVDIRLVNTTTGEIVVSEFGEVTRTDAASAWGLRILGIGGDARNNVQMDDDSKGKLLRWALDESYKKMLPRIDGKFSRAQPSICPKCKVELEAGKKFCTKCGTSVEPPKCAKCGTLLDAGAKFCGSCGTKVEEAPKK